MFKLFILAFKHNNNSCLTLNHSIRHQNRITSHHTIVRKPIHPINHLLYFTHLDCCYPHKHPTKTCVSYYHSCHLQLPPHSPCCCHCQHFRKLLNYARVLQGLLVHFSMDSLLIWYLTRRFRSLRTAKPYWSQSVVLPRHHGSEELYWAVEQNTECDIERMVKKRIATYST